MHNRKTDYLNLKYYERLLLAILPNNKTKPHFVIKSMAYPHHSKIGYNDMLWY